MPISKGKLVKTFALANKSSAFLFEPKELVAFETAWRWQRKWQQLLLDNPQSKQAVWLLQHQSCYTLGRGANLANLLFDLENPPAVLFRIDRGGEVTHHLPGQLIGYPVIDLQRYKKDLDWYLRELEQVLIEVLDVLGLVGQRLPGITGLWVDGYKVGAIGIGCRRWITQHGFSLNVDCALEGFAEIIPCGLAGRSVGRLSDWIPGLTVEDVKPLIRECLAKRFGLDFESA